jgi:ketosteroid isomerase-like protein
MPTATAKGMPVACVDVMETTTPTDEIQQLLNSMARAVVAGDGRTVAEMWEVPALVLSDEGAMPVNRQDEFEAFFGGAKAQYNARGIMDTRAEIVRIEWATRRLATVQVRWPHLDADGKICGSETSTYVIRRNDKDELKLRVAVMHGTGG